MNYKSLFKIESISNTNSKL